MKSLFLGIPLLVFSIVKFDTQDQIFKICGAQSYEPQTEQTMSVQRTMKNGKDVLVVRTAAPAKWIYLNNFTKSYKVKKISQKEFIVYCNEWADYWNDEDVIEILFIR
jgi:hypothetical protein